MMGLHNRGGVRAEAEEKVVGLNVTIECDQELNDIDYERQSVVKNTDKTLTVFVS
jgi:hypothetical protein